MPSSTPGESYAPSSRRDGYVRAMQAITARRRPGPVQVYVSVSARRLFASDWPLTLRRMSSALPAGVMLDTFPEAFPGGRYQYRHRWQGYAADLDGLVVFGTRTAGRRRHLSDQARVDVDLGSRSGAGGALACEDGTGLFQVDGRGDQGPGVDGPVGVGLDGGVEAG